MALTKASFSMIEGSVFNVKDYGAVGDGVADDTAALQATLFAAEGFILNNDVGRGKTVFFPTGIYRTTSTLNLGAAYVTLLGEGPRSSIVAYEPTTGNAMTAPGGMSNFNVKSLGIYGSRFGTTHTSGYGMQLIGSNVFSEFDDVNISGFANGLYIEAGYYITLRHVQSFGTNGYTSFAPAPWSSGTTGFRFGRGVPQAFTGNGVTQSFTLFFHEVDWVTIDGNFVGISQYNVVGNDIVFNVAPASGALIRVITGFGGTTTILLDQCYIANYETDIYNVEVSGLEFENLILEWCDTGLKTEQTAMGDLYAERIFKDAIEAYMPVKIKCTQSRSFWYQPGATDNLFRNPATQQISLIDELSHPPAVLAYLSAPRTITEPIANTGIIIWDKKQDATNAIQSNGRIACPGREGWFRMSGTIQLSQMTVGDDVLIQMVLFNPAGAISQIQALRVVAAGTEDFNYVKIEQIAYLIGGFSFGITVGSNDNTLQILGQTVGGNNRESWVSVEKLAY